MWGKYIRDMQAAPSQAYKTPPSAPKATRSGVRGAFVLFAQLLSWRR